MSGQQEPAAASTQPSRAVVLASCLSLSVVSGSFYSWSLLLPSLQTSLGCARAPLSAVFSLATICFTAGTSGGALLLDRVSASTILVIIAATSAAGLLLASLATAGARAAVGLPLLAAGYGLAFGSMSGLAYAQNAKVSTSRLFAGRNGFATGLLVAGRAAAPLVATPLVLRALARGGAGSALRALSLYVGLALAPAALALRGLRYEAPGAAPKPSAATGAAGADSSDGPGRGTTIALWLNLFFGSGPGLLCHGHAAALLGLCRPGDGSLAALGVGAMAVGSVAGRLGGGVLIDLVPARRCLVVLPCLAAPVVLAPLLRPASVALTVGALCGCGLIYGLNAVALPVLVSRLYGPRRFAAVYGQVFTAWGTGGILAPWLAGRLFDLTGGYNAALVISSGALLVSGLVAIALPSEPERGDV